MADSLSITTSLMAIVTAAVQSTQSLKDAVNRYRTRDFTLYLLRGEIEDAKSILFAFEQLLMDGPSPPIIDSENSISISILLCELIGRYTTICHEFEEVMEQFIRQPKAGLTDWAKMEFMGGDIYQFMDMALKEYNEIVKDTAYFLEVRLQQIDHKTGSLVTASGSNPSNIDSDLNSERRVAVQCLQICQDAKSHLESLAIRDSNLPQEASPGNSSNALEDHCEAQLLSRHALNDNQISREKIITRLREKLESAMTDSGSSERVQLREGIHSSMKIARVLQSLEFREKYGPGFTLASINEEQIDSSERQVSNGQEKLSIEEQEIHEDSDDAKSTASTLFSNYSTSSASSYASQANTLEAATTEVVTLLLDDKDIQRFLTNALAKKERYTVLKGTASLLNWLGRRLKSGSDSHVESGLAKLFSRRRRNRLIVERLLRETELRNSDADRREVSQVLLNQKINKGILENYLEEQFGLSMINGSINESDDILNQEESEGSEDDDGDNNEADDGHNVTSNIEVAKNILASNESFLRFKEELEDFVEPLKNKNVWSKILWDGDERVRFDLSNTVCRLTSMDKLKLAAEETVRMPILWWPLKQPRKYLPPSRIRIIWICSCGYETYIDVPLDEARKYRRRCTTGPNRATFGHSPSLPTTNTGSSSSTLVQNWISSLAATMSQIRDELGAIFRDARGFHRTRRACDSNTTNTTDPSASLKYIHWCVDIAAQTTLLRDICFEKLNGRDFIEELRSSYRKLRGWRWFVSLTTCTEIKFIKLIRVHQDEDKVACVWNEEVLPKEQTEYIYHLYPPSVEKQIHVLRAEKALIDYYHGHASCLTGDRIRNLILGIPHRFTGDKLQMKPGYGIYGRPGFTLYKFSIIMLVSQVWALAFAVWWLCHHPGDLQNAFAPAFYSFGLVTVLVAIPDTYFP